MGISDTGIAIHDLCPQKLLIVAHFCAANSYHSRHFISAINWEWQHGQLSHKRLGYVGSDAITWIWISTSESLFVLGLQKLDSKSCQHPVTIWQFQQNTLLFNFHNMICTCTHFSRIVVTSTMKFYRSQFRCQNTFSQFSKISKSQGFQSLDMLLYLIPHLTYNLLGQVSFSYSISVTIHATLTKTRVLVDSWTGSRISLLCMRSWCMVPLIF